jgi:hypothetical protein
MKTSMPDGGWEWFDPVAAVELEGGNDCVDEMDVAAVFGRCFRGGDGMRALAYLRGLTMDRALGPGADDAVLRHMEGQRQLVAHVCALVARGVEG